MRLAQLITVLCVPAWVGSYALGLALGHKPGNWAWAALALAAWTVGPLATGVAAMLWARGSGSAPARAFAGMVAAISVVVFFLVLPVGLDAADPRWGGLHDARFAGHELPSLSRVTGASGEASTGRLDSREGGAELHVYWLPGPSGHVEVARLLDNGDELDWTYDPEDSVWRWPHGADTKGHDGTGLVVPCGATDYVVVTYGDRVFSMALLRLAANRLTCPGGPG